MCRRAPGLGWKVLLCVLFHPEDTAGAMSYRHKLKPRCPNGSNCSYIHNDM